MKKRRKYFSKYKTHKPGKGKWKTELAVIEMGKDREFWIYALNTRSSFFGNGKTVLEAKDDFRNSVKEIIELSDEMGECEPDNLMHTRFVYRYNYSSFVVKRRK